MVCVWYLLVADAYADPESETYLGSWRAGDEAGMSILGRLVITETKIMIDGSRSSHRCRTSYTVVDRTRGPRPFPDEGWPFSVIPSEAIYVTVKVRLGAEKCLGNAAYFRFAIPSDRQDHLDVVLYDKTDKPAGWFGFYRQ